jgi:RNA polymerase sigma-70 factor (ECF subfamily)
METETGTRDDERRHSEQLVRSILAGDDKAFDELVQLHQKFVFNLCYRLLGDYDEANDCAQDVFVAVFRSLGNFRFESAFRTWLYRVTANTCKNRMRSLEYRIRSRRVRMDVDNEDGYKVREISDNRPSPAGELKRKELGKLLQAAINRLPADQKLVVVLRDMEGRTYDEIVEITGFKLGTLKSKLSRARLRLRQALEGTI